MWNAVLENPSQYQEDNLNSPSFRAISELLSFYLRFHTKLFQVN